MSERDIQIADLIEKAADLIEERGWCKETCARDANGNPETWDHDRCVSFCGFGACYRVALENLMELRLASAATAELNRGVFGGGFPAWQDRQRSAKPVIAKMREVAANLRGGA